MYQENFNNDYTTGGFVGYKQNELIGDSNELKHGHSSFINNDMKHGHSSFINNDLKHGHSSFIQGGLVSGDDSNGFRQGGFVGESSHHSRGGQFRSSGSDVRIHRSLTRQYHHRSQYFEPSWRYDHGNYQELYHISDGGVMLNNL